MKGLKNIKFQKIHLNIFILAIFLFQTLPNISLHLLDALERIASDIRLRATLPHIIDDRIIIVDIDEKSIDSLGQWPWSRDHLANLIDILFDDYQVKVVGFDILFSEADSHSHIKALNELQASPLGKDPLFQEEYFNLRKKMDYDQQFANAIKKHPVILGTIFQQKNPQQKHQLPAPISMLSDELSDSLQLYKPIGFSANLPRLQQDAEKVGFFDNPNIDYDGQYRRSPLLQIFQNGIYPSLALAVTQVALENVPINLIVHPIDENLSIIDQVQLGSLLIPVDNSASIQIPYLGPQGSFIYLSIIDVLHKKISKEMLQNKIILVGTSAHGLLDLRTTPVDKAMPGIEIHANMISAILDNRVPTHPTAYLVVELFNLLMLALLMILIPNKLTPIKVIIFTLLLLFVDLKLNAFAWKQGIDLTITPPLLLIFSIFIVHMSWGFLVDNRKKQIAIKLFGQYVPPSLVDELVLKPELITQKSQSKELSVLFADVRNFTQISENLSPEQLSQLLNELLTPMTEAIYQTRGTIDKYMGDAIMAFWGAPIFEVNHAALSISAALDMQQKLIQINHDFSLKNWPQLQIGIGISTGQMNVGNMGSKYRMAYTVLGDTVNLGSRLESLTKNYGVDIIVSEATKLAAPNFDYLFLDKIRVKGKNESVNIYEVINPLTFATLGIDKQSLLDTQLEFEKALQFYSQKRWKESELILKVLQKQPLNRKYHCLYTEYLTRIQRYQIDPPPASWDGVFTYKEK